MEKSNLPSIFPTSVNNTSVQNYHSNLDDMDQSIIQTYQSQLLADLDEINSKFQKTQRTCDDCIQLLKIQSNSSSQKTLEDFDSVQSQLSKIYQHSLDISRRSQNLSLQIQSSSSLSLPKALGSVNESFSTFKQEFDNSIKNIVFLSSNLSRKITSTSNKLDKLSYLKQQIQNSLSDVHQISNSHQQLSQSIEETAASINQSLDESLTRVKKKVQSELSSIDKLLVTSNNEKSSGKKNLQISTPDSPIDIVFLPSAQEGTKSNSNNDTPSLPKDEKDTTFLLTAASTKPQQQYEKNDIEKIIEDDAKRLQIEKEATKMAISKLRDEIDSASERMTNRLLKFTEQNSQKAQKQIEQLKQSLDIYEMLPSDFQTTTNYNEENENEFEILETKLNNLENQMINPEINNSDKNQGKIFELLVGFENDKPKFFLCFNDGMFLE